MRRPRSESEDQERKKKGEKQKDEKKDWDEDGPGRRIVGVASIGTRAGALAHLPRPLNGRRRAHGMCRGTRRHRRTCLGRRFTCRQPCRGTGPEPSHRTKPCRGTRIGYWTRTGRLMRIGVLVHVGEVVVLRPRLALGWQRELGALRGLILTHPAIARPPGVLGPRRKSRHRPIAPIDLAAGPCLCHLPALPCERPLRHCPPSTAGPTAPDLPKSPATA